MSDKTHTYDKYSSEKTSLSGQGAKIGGSLNTHDLNIGDTIELKSKKYSVLDIISTGTGEANIFKIKDENGNNLVLKLYFEFNNIKEEPNQEALTRIKSIVHDDILMLHDFGTGLEKYKQKYCYEITDFAEGGDLFKISDFKNKYTPTFIENHVVNEIFNGIQILHKNRIYHCDLKPTNIFYKDASQTDLIIGDYGSSKTADIEAQKETRKTSTVKGTETYLSPEQARGIIKSSNDFYSFGMVILHLLYPEQLAQNEDFTKIDTDKFGRIVERQESRKPIIQYNSAHSRLNNLIEGLTQVDSQRRFGEVEVSRWIKGDFIEIKNDYPDVKPIKLGSVTISTEEHLIRFIDANLNSWYEELIEDESTFMRFKEWIDTSQNISIRKEIVELINFYQPYGKDFVKEAICRYFKPDRDLQVDMNLYNFYKTDDVNETVSNYIAKLDEIWKITKREKMRFYLFNLEFSLYQLLRDGAENSNLSPAINKFLSVFGLTTNKSTPNQTYIQTVFDPKDAHTSGALLLRLFYDFNKFRTFRDLKNNEINSLDEIGFYLLDNEHAFQDINIKLEIEKYIVEKKPSLNLSTSYTEFLLNCFSDKVEISIEIDNLTIDKYRNYVIKYMAFRTLTDYFKSVGVMREFKDTPENLLQLQFKGTQWGLIDPDFEQFISLLRDKHSPFELKTEIINSLKTKFRPIVLRKLIKMFLPQAFSLIISFMLLTAMVLVYLKKLQIDEKWNFLW